MINGKPGNEDGFALLTVIWALGLMMVLITVFSLTSRTQTKTVGNLIANTQARLDAESGLRLGILALLDQRVGNRGEEPRSNTFLCRLQSGTVVFISISDEAGKVDLNSASSELLAALFEAKGQDARNAQAIAHAILDFRDADDTASPQGAEAKEYAEVGLSWGPKNAAFFRVEELEQVFGVTEEVFLRVRPYVTVHSLQAGIDLTAAPPKLQNLIEGLQAEPRFQGIALTARSSQSFFTIRAETLSAAGPTTAYEAIVQLPRNRNPAYKILTWRRVESSSDVSTKAEALPSVCPL